MQGNTPDADNLRFRADDLRFRADDLRFRADDLRFRAAGAGDASAVAGLHGDSWRRHYRGAFSDAFLDRDVAGYLLPLWTERLATPDPRARTILAEYDAARGAICVERDNVSPPGDEPANLNGGPVSLKYAWHDPSTLLPAAERPTLLPR